MLEAGTRYRSKSFTTVSHSESSGSRHTGLPARPSSNSCAGHSDKSVAINDTYYSSDPNAPSIFRMI